MPRQKQSPTKEEKIKQRLSHVLFVYRPAFHVIAAGRDRPAALNIKESRNKSSIHACLQCSISFYKKRKKRQFQSRQQQQHRLLFSLFSSNGTATPALPITAADPSDRCVYWGIYGRRQWSVVQERSRDPIDGVRARGLLFFSFSFFFNERVGGKLCSVAMTPFDSSLASAGWVWKFSSRPSTFYYYYSESFVIEPSSQSSAHLLLLLPFWDFLYRGDVIRSASGHWVFFFLLSFRRRPFIQRPDLFYPLFCAEREIGAAQCVNAHILTLTGPEFADPPAGCLISEYVAQA